MLKLVDYLKTKGKIQGNVFEVGRLIESAKHNLISRKTLKPEHLKEMEDIVKSAADAYTKEQFDECIERMRELPIKK